MKKFLFLLIVPFLLVACGTTLPACQNSIYGCNGGGARATAAAKPGAAPAPSKPSKPGHHGGKPGHGKGDGNHGHSGPPGKGGGKGGKGGYGK